MIVRSGSSRRHGMGAPYWDLPGAAQRGYLGLPGGFNPLQQVAAANNAPAPSLALLTSVNRMRNVGGPSVGNLPVPRAAVNFRRVSPRGASGPILTGGTVVRGGMRGFRGLGDCLNAMQSEGVCPDGSPYLGTLDSGGAAPVLLPPPPTPPVVLQYPIGTSTAAAPSPLSSLFASVLPASFTTLQEAIAQPGQVVKTPTALITGAGGSTIPGLTTSSLGASSLSGLLLPIILIGGAVLLFSKK